MPTAARGLRPGTSSHAAGTYSFTVTDASGCTATTTGDITQPVAGLIVISQIYGGGGEAGAPYHDDYVELFNRGNSAVDVTGWSVQYASAAGSAWSTTALSGTVPPGGYFLVQEAAGAGNGAALPTPDAFGTIALSGTAGKVAL